MIDDGAIAEPNAALHFTIGHDGKSKTHQYPPAHNHEQTANTVATASQTPSITSQISTLRDLLTTSAHIHPAYQRAAAGALPVVVHTNNKDVIAHLIALKQDTNAHIVVMGGAEAHQLAVQLAAARVPVVVAPFWGCEPLFWDARGCLPGPPLADALGPRVLLDAGVAVAIASWDDTNNHVRNSLWEAGWVAGPGNQSLALDLVSRNVEDILRLARAGDVVVYEGDPFDFGARIALSFEEGKVRSCYPDTD